MKKLLLMLAAVGMIFTACENNGGVEEENGGGTPFIPEISYSPKIVEFESVGGEKEITITANFEYEVSTSADWLDVEILETGIKVVAEKNTKTSERSTSIAISNEKYNITKVVEVKQAAYVPKIELSQQSMEVEFEPNTYTVSVTSPYSWDAVSKNDWIIVESKKGIAGTKELKFSVKRNEEEEIREGTIVVKNKDYNLVSELYITQKAFEPKISIEPKTLNFTIEESSQDVTIDANFDYTVTTEAEWFTLSQSKEGITITVPDYAEVEKRTAEITISNEKYGISEVVKVSQAAFVPTITIEKKELNFNVEGGEQSVNITANFDYNVTNDADWIDCTKADNSISIKVLASDIASERTAEITISNEKYGISEVVKVVQAKFVPVITIDKKELNFDVEGGEQIVKITANVDYNVTDNADWMDCTKADNSISIKVSASDITSERTAEITISNEKYGISEVVKVVHAKFVPVITIDKKELNFDVEGGEQIVKITANVDYNVTDNADWMDCTKADNSISIKVLASDITSERTAEITIANETYGISEIIKIMQDPQDPQRLIFYTTSDNSIIEPNNKDAFGANIISNTYNNGQGVIIFDAPISSIKKDAFRNCSSLASITIPDSVTSIGNYAFYYCSSLTSITIPDSVTSIGEKAFSYCSKLTSITIPDSVKSIGSSAFAVCSKLTSVTIGNGVTSIGKGVFNSCSKLTSVTIPDSVTSIGEKAFSYCSKLTSITIPDSVKSIGDSAFEGCSSLTSVTIPNSVKSIGNYAFYRCSSLTSVTIPNSVTSIGSCAFQDCGSLASITIPDSVTSIGEKAFFDCNSLTSVTIGNSVTSIGSSAFYDCSSLTSMTIPDSVTSIGSCAFGGCRSLTSITIPDSVTSIEAFAFCFCSSLTSITIPDSVTSIENGAFGGCRSLTSITIPDSVTSIEKNAFEYCSSLTSVTIPNSVTSIEAFAFYRCSSLTSVTIPNSVTSIGNDAFSECSSLTSVTIPNSVTSIGEDAFSECSSLTSVTIPNSVTSIGDEAFEDCSSLISVTIGNSVTSIGEKAFYNCSSLTSVYCKATTPPSGGEYMFSWNASGRKIYVPTASVEAYKSAEGWRGYADNIVGYDF